MSLVVLAAIVVLGVFVVFGLKDLVATRIQTALPPSYLGGRLPPGTPVINSHASAQLRLAVSLVTLVLDAEELDADTAKDAAAWLRTATSDGTTDAILLEQAGALLHTIESQDKVFNLIRNDRIAKITAWLDDYLTRTPGRR